MHLRVLGAAAGGGFPQWNCACANCRAVRAGSAVHRARTQASLAVSADGQSWFLLNVSPDVRAQIESCPALHPGAPRGSPIAGAVLTNGDLDACLGLFSLRESEPLSVYATLPVQHGLVEHNLFCRTLQRFDGHTQWFILHAHERQALLLRDGRPSGLYVEAFSVPGKVPLHLEGIVLEHPEQNVGLLIYENHAERAVCFSPSVGAFSSELENALSRSVCCFFDGTFWSDGELDAQGLGKKTARQMAHWPLGGAQGSLGWLKNATHCRRILIHVNNTNPILNEQSPERRQVEASGIEVAYDGLEIEL